jgi:hypothetical protein
MERVDLEDGVWISMARSTSPKLNANPFFPERQTTKIKRKTKMK